MANPEHRAMVRTSADLNRHLQHCALEVSSLLYSEEMIPEDLLNKVTRDPQAVRDIVTCLTGRVVTDGRELTKIVEVMLRVPALKKVVEKLKENYAACGGTQELPSVPITTEVVGSDPVSSSVGGGGGGGGQPSHRRGAQVDTGMEQEQEQEQEQRQQRNEQEQRQGHEQRLGHEQRQGQEQRQEQMQGQGVWKEEDLNRQITNKHIDTISRSLDCGWRTLPRPLEMGNKVVNALDRELGKEDDKRRGFFYKWKRMKGENATYKLLIDALVEIGHKCDADEVYKMLGSHAEEKTPDHVHPVKEEEGMTPSKDLFHAGECVPRPASRQQQHTTTHDQPASEMPITRTQFYDLCWALKAAAAAALLCAVLVAWWILPADIEIETPLFTQAEQEKMYRDNKPEGPRGNAERASLQSFSLEVELLLQTVNDNEYQAAVTFLRPPSAEFSKAIVFPKVGMVVGVFAGKKTALIQTKVGLGAGDFVEEAIEMFPSVSYVIGIGVCYAFDQSMYKPGDVVVSEQISDLASSKFDADGEVENRGQTVAVVNDLYRMFCQDLIHEPDFKVSENRSSRVYSGTLLSYPMLLTSKEMRDRFHNEIRTAVGGEMEGGQLLRFEQKRKIKGIIAIKGIVNYAEGSQAKDWQFTSASAALHYAQSKLRLEPSLLVEPAAVEPSPSVMPSLPPQPVKPQSQPVASPLEKAGTANGDNNDECHEMKMSDWKVLDNYLGGVQSKPEKLCNYLDLANCNDLDRVGKLDSFNMATNFLEQKPGACWEHFVSILCDLLHDNLARTVSTAHGVNFTKHCVH